MIAEFTDPNSSHAFLFTYDLAEYAELVKKALFFAEFQKLCPERSHS